MTGLPGVARIWLALTLLVVVLLPGSAGAEQTPPPAVDSEEAVSEPCSDVPLWQKPACEVQEGVRAGVGSIVNAG
jgi:hypothetical protein